VREAGGEQHGAQRERRDDADGATTAAGEQRGRRDGQGARGGARAAEEPTFFAEELGDAVVSVGVAVISSVMGPSRPLVSTARTAT
jgi:hypothetical protein